MQDTTSLSPGVTPTANVPAPTAADGAGSIPHVLMVRRAAAAVIAMAGTGLFAGAGHAGGVLPLPIPGSLHH